MFEAELPIKLRLRGIAARTQSPEGVERRRRSTDGTSARVRRALEELLALRSADEIRSRAARFRGVGSAAASGQVSRVVTGGVEVRDVGRDAGSCASIHDVRCVVRCRGLGLSWTREGLLCVRDPDQNCVIFIRTVAGIARGRGVVHVTTPMTETRHKSVADTPTTNEI